MSQLKIDHNGALYVPAEQLNEPCVVVVSNGQVELVPLISFGSLEVVVQDKKVQRIHKHEQILFGR